MRNHSVALLFLALFASSTEAARHPDESKIGERDINRGIYGFPNFYNTEEERSTGADIDQVLQRSNTIVVGATFLPRLQEIAERIVASSDYHGTLVIRVTLGIDRNAFAVMGGYVFIDTSIVALADSDDEIAAVLAHEVAHLAARHGAELLSYQRFLQSRLPNRQAVTDAVLDRAHDSEFEADELAVQYLRRAAYRPEALASVLVKIAPARQRSGDGTHTAHFGQNKDIEARVRQIRKALDSTK
ncbi:MAG: M48 family metalloprotease [Acidobacteria bacterium]|nr:M48 family metalloprotease [Acidobacteriota bacterium]